MTGQEFNYVQETIECEGFYGAFHDYTDFQDKVQDPEFHRIRLEYLKAAQNLADYCGISL